VLVPIGTSLAPDWGATLHSEEEAMSGRQAALTVALAFAAQIALAQDDRAVPRDGGSSGSSSVGSSHHSGASSSSAGASSSGSSHSASASSRYEPTDAQRRHPRAGTGTGWRRGGSVRYGSPYYIDPYRYSYYYGPSYYGGWGRYWGYSPYYYSGYYGYSPSYYYGGSRYSGGSRAGALRVLVEPRDTRVYVDGYFAGIADDFDGLFQRLHVSPGRHEISLRLDGHRTQNLKVYVPWDQTLKIHHKMVPGQPGEVSEQVVGRPEDVSDSRDRSDRYEGRDDREREEDGDEDAGPADARGDRGTLRLRVEPTDASVYVDGVFRGTGRLRALRLPAGRHRIEVVRPGYRTIERDVEVHPGREAEVEIQLERS
jgi:hypothetical protein